MNVNKDDLAKLGYEYTLTPDEDAFLVRFPGVPQLISAGHSLAQAHAMAKDAVELWLGEMVPGKQAPMVPPVQVQPGKHYVTLADIMPIGDFRRFGPGPSYEVGQPIRQLEDGDWLLEITVLETGEKVEHRLSAVLADPAADLPVEGTTTTIYKIPAPYSKDRMIEVYGDPDNGWYEWRVVTAGRIERDTKEEGYGSPEIALRDALVAMSE